MRADLLEGHSDMSQQQCKGSNSGPNTPSPDKISLLLKELKRLTTAFPMTAKINPKKK